MIFKWIFNFRCPLDVDKISASGDCHLGVADSNASYAYKLHFEFAVNEEV